MSDFRYELRWSDSHVALCGFVALFDAVYFYEHLKSISTTPNTYYIHDSLKEINVTPEDSE